MKNENQIVVWFKNIRKNDIGIVGGKGANLGEMVSLNLPIPNGFVVTAYAYFKFLDESNLRPKIKEYLKGVDKKDPQSYQIVSEKIKKLIINADIPKDISWEIISAYLKLGGIFKNSLVAIRSSATAEDLPTASFAGQQSTFLNIKGETEVVEKVRDCWASLFEARAIFYREENKFDHFRVGIAVPVQKMVQSETSGVMFTCDPVSSQKNLVVIEAIYGLGEMIVQGTVTPDHYEVSKDPLKIVNKIISRQAIMLTKSGKETKEVKIPLTRQQKQKISDQKILDLAKIGKKLHQHYYFPQDIEWAIEKNKIYIVQTRPVTTVKQTEETIQKAKDLPKISSKRPVLIQGQGASPGIVAGQVKVVSSAKEIRKIENGDVLVTQMTTPDFVPAMKKAVAIVTDRGGQTSHAAIVSRELGIPCVVGTEKGSEVLKKEKTITVDGFSGKIYRGGIDTLSKVISEEKNYLMDSVQKSSSGLIRTATKLYVNLADPLLAEEVSKKNVDGVGLLRAEFMIADIGKHPKKMIKSGKRKEFIEKLSEGIALFCKSFNPRPVVYRTTDFKSNEYRNLSGGQEFEPVESNPMLGFRGASRYIVNADVFEMEIEAIKKVRNKLGFKNLWVMIPFVRTPEELADVKKILVASGLSRSPSFKLWMMVEIPSNVILIEKFIEVGIDGVSIGSNDLTMLILGTDRDNQDVANVFDERNEAVLWSIEKVVKACHKAGITCSICGQAPTQYPDLVESLVDWGITSISVNPDAIESSREIIYYSERRLVKKK